jgi:hypothetical protein
VLVYCGVCSIQVPNISRVEYTLLDVNEEGFVSIKHSAQFPSSSTGRLEQQQPGRLGAGTQPPAAAMVADAVSADTCWQFCSCAMVGSIKTPSCAPEAVSNSLSSC